MGSFTQSVFGELSGRAKGVARLVVSLSLLTAVVAVSGLDRVRGVLAALDPAAFALVAVIGILGVALSAKKWQVLLRARGEPKPFREVLRIYYFGSFVNLVLPSTIGGDAVKATSMSQAIDDSATGYASVFMERYTGLLALMSWALLAILLRPQVVSTRLAVAFGSILAGTTALSLFVFCGVGRDTTDRLLRYAPFDLNRRVDAVVGATELYRGHPRVVVYAFLLSLIFHLNPIGVHIILARALGVEVPLLFLFVMVPVANVILFVPVSIQGVGVREALYPLFLSSVGVALPQAVALSLSVQAYKFAVGAVGVLSVLDVPFPDLP